MLNRLKTLWRQRAEPVRQALMDRAALFDPAAQDLAAYERLMAKPAAATRYIMYFTPRSGSSWLTDLAKQTPHLSKLGECFNPKFLPRMAAKLNAADMDQFIQAMLRQWNTDDVFGAQLTFYQMRRCFGGPEAFLRHFPDVPSFWLLREDIVLQAVSLVKMQQTNLRHSVLDDAETRAAADQAFVYDADRIAHFVTHVFDAEEGSEAMFAAHGLSPLRMSYEHNVTMGGAQVMNAMAHHIGVAPVAAGTLASGHQKIGTDRNADFADRFRAGHTSLLARIEAARAPRLAAIDRTLPARLPAPYRVDQNAG